MNQLQSNSYFDKFWLLYPVNKPDQKDDCKLIFEHLCHAGLHELILAILKNQINVYRYKKNKRIWVANWCYPINWLKEERWFDDIKIDDKVKNLTPIRVLGELSNEEYDIQEYDARLIGDEFLRLYWKRDRPDQLCPLDQPHFNYEEYKKIKKEWLDSLSAKLKSSPLRKPDKIDLTNILEAEPLSRFHGYLEELEKSRKSAKDLIASDNKPFTDCEGNEIKW